MQLSRTVTNAVIVACWVSGIAVWVAAPVVFARRAGRVRERRTGLTVPYLFVIIAMIALLPLGDSLALRLFWVQIVGAVLLVCSTGFAIWARLVLGDMWSSLAVVREGHQLRTGGPYSLTRHPIYTGILGMVYGSTLLSGFGSWLVVSVAVTILLFGKSSTEERLMVETFGDAYGGYRASVPRLIPFARLTRRDRTP